MSKNQIIFTVACLLVIIFCAISVRHKITSSYKNKNAQVEDTLKANKDYEVEYASTTNKKFYQKMVGMEKNSTLVFNGFPTCLTSILHTHTQRGNEIFTTETDTLYLVDWDLNRADINKYPYYIVKDNHNNLWSLFRHNSDYILTRHDIKDKDYAHIVKNNH